MSNIQRLFKLLLKKDFYDAHKHKLPHKAFDEIGQDLLPTVAEAHSRYQRDLATDDIGLLHLALHPTLTTANKNTVEAYLDNIRDADTIAEDVAHEVYKSMWRSQVGNTIAELGLELHDGKSASLDTIKSYVGKVADDFVPVDFNERVTTDPVALFGRLADRGRWSFNIPYLKEKIKGIRPGTFIILLARPEAGKTATIVNLMAGREGFAAQGARVHLLANEEGADATAGRSICCFNETSFAEALANPAAADTPAWRELSDRLTYVHQPEMTLEQLDWYCKRNKPDVLIVDQLDHVMTSMEYNRGDERLGGVYRRFREILAVNDCVGIGVSQASAEAEGKSRVTFAMAEGSKTSKAAAADVIIGLGRADEGDRVDVEANEVIRYFTVSKNKLSGWKGTITCKLIQDQSRFIQ